MIWERPPLLTVAQAAEELGVPKSSLYAEIRNGRLEAKVRRGTTRGYLLTKEALEKWMKEGLVDAYPGVR